MKVQWKIVKHEELEDSYKEKIAVLKNQHWKYGIQSQLEWMNKNIHVEDLHLIGKVQEGKNDDICAYLNMIQLRPLFDGVQFECIGIGNVCVDKKYEHMGYGIKMLTQANEYIKQTRKQGILLCKDLLVPFYERCGWRLSSSTEVLIESDKYIHKIMLYPDIKQELKKIEIERNF